MSSTHPVPLVIRSADGTQREATEPEIARYAVEKPTSYARWLTSNRCALGALLKTQGVEHSAAWTSAFERYPSTEAAKRKPRFVFEL